MEASEAPAAPETPAETPAETPPVAAPIEVAPVELVAPPPPRGLGPWFAGLSREGRWVFWATVVTGIWRLIFVGFIHQPWKLDYSDMHNYISAGLHFAERGRPTDSGDWYYPSGTASMIALWVTVFGVHLGEILLGLFQALMATAVVPLTYITGRRFFSDPRVGTWAALLYSVHYLPMGFAGMFMSENYLTIGLAMAMGLMKPDKVRSGFAAGLALGFGAWAKSQAFMLAPLWAMLLVLRGRRWGPAVAVVVGVLIWVIPVSIVATKKAGVPAFISTNGGQTFALGQCPVRSVTYEHPTEHWRIGWSAPDLNQRTPRGEVEATWPEAVFDVPFNHSSYYMGVGIDCIKRYPAAALRAMFYHVADTFAGPPWSNIVPWPDSHAGYIVPAAISNWFIAYFMAPFAFLALWLKRHEDGIWITFGLPFMSVMASAVLFHGDPRFREPYDFLFMLAGTQGWLLFRDWRKSRRTPAPAPAPEPIVAAQ